MVGVTISHGTLYDCIPFKMVPCYLLIELNYVMYLSSTLSSNSTVYYRVIQFFRTGIWLFKKITEPPLFELIITHTHFNSPFGFKPQKFYCRNIVHIDGCIKYFILVIKTPLSYWDDIIPHLHWFSFDSCRLWCLGLWSKTYFLSKVKMTDTWSFPDEVSFWRWNLFTIYCYMDYPSLLIISIWCKYLLLQLQRQWNLSKPNPE